MASEYDSRSGRADEKENDPSACLTFFSLESSLSRGENR